MGLKRDARTRVGLARGGRGDPSLGVISFHPLETGLLVLIAMGPAVLLLVSAFHLDSIGGAAVMAASMGFLIAVLVSCGARIRTTQDHLILGFAPFWRSRLRRGDIADLSTVSVRPWEDYGGWGIKGSPRRKGLLYSAGGTEAVRVELGDGRVYVASVAPGSADAVVVRLEEWMRA